MFLACRPSAAQIDRFLRDSSTLPLSCDPVGRLLDRDAPPDRVWTIGRGARDFARACDALRRWQQFDLGWLELHPRHASIEVGTNVAVLVRHLGFWSLNGCRVVYHVDESNHGRRFGYAYATLPTHAATGEELFEVALEASTGIVTYAIRAVARPRAFAARVGWPFVRVLQTRFRRDSSAAMQRAVAS
jgi:uncharacterized protein (UPF0548 family)